VPEFALSILSFEQALASCVKVVALDAPMDYSDCISLAEKLSETDQFLWEGGIRNVGRRDGAGTILLNAYETMGELPDYYFQAIGSGTGAIATYESALRISGKRETRPRLFVSQNLPFAPVYHAWKRRVSYLPQIEVDAAKRKIDKMYAKVLSNRQPLYEVPGGIVDALKESGGTVIGVSNDQAISAAALFKSVENVKIEPAAAVAFASLLLAISKRMVPRDASVLLNITGGVHVASVNAREGVRKFPDLRANRAMGTQQIVDRISTLCMQEKMTA
jgi:cysteate synthase